MYLLMAYALLANPGEISCLMLIYAKTGIRLPNFGTKIQRDTRLH